MHDLYLFINFLKEFDYEDEFDVHEEDPESKKSQVTCVILQVTQQPAMLGHTCLKQ
jgi:hypothetical protein